MLTSASLLRPLALLCALATSSAGAGASELPALVPVPARALRVTAGQLERQSGEPLVLEAAGAVTPGAVTPGAVTPGAVTPGAVTPGAVTPGAGASGAAGHSFFVRSPMLRAWVGHRPPTAGAAGERAVVELDFVYLGPTRGQAPLASGELRRQVGLELRAQDSCNLLYVMWRIEPKQALMVSLKSNPGQRRHSECADRGYVNLAPEHSEPLPPLRAGERHVLRASASARELVVWVDGRSRWRGRLPAAAAAFDGPVGVRADNAELELQLRSTEPTK